MYLPNVQQARTVARYQIGHYLALLMTDCKSVGRIQYLYVLYVLKIGDTQPIFAVTSETSDYTGAPMPFLGMFPGDRHVNLGMSADWRDQDKFTTKALQLVAAHFRIAQSPVLLPLNDSHLN